MTIRRIFTSAPLSSRRTIFMATLHTFLIWAMAIGLVWQNYHQSVESWKRSAEAISLTVAAYAGESQRTAELVVRNMAEWAQDENIETPARFNEVMAGRRYYDAMRESLVGMRQAGIAGILSATGEVLNSTLAWPPLPLNVAERRGFQAMLEAPAGAIHVTTTGPAGKNTSPRFYLSNQVRTKSGELLGLAVIGLDADYFASFFRKLDLGPDSWVSLFRLDGTLLATSLTDQSLLGRRFVESNSYRTFASGRLGQASIVTGPFRLRPEVPNGSRILVVNRTDSFPTFVSVAIGESAFLGPWRERTFLIAAIALVLSVLTVLAALRVTRLISREAASRRAEAEREVLEAIVDTPSALTAIADRTGRVLRSNVRFREMMESAGDPAEALFNPGLKGREALLAFAGDGQGTTRAEADLQLERAGQETKRLHFSLARQTLPDAGECMVLVGHDETQRFRAQQAVAMSTKLVTLGEITTSIAHEVSQPLNVIRMAAQNALLEGEAPTEPDPDFPEEDVIPPMEDREFREFALSKFHGIIRQVDRAAVVLSRMRIFSRKGEADETFDLREAVRTASALMLPSLRADKIEFTEELAADPLPVKGSRALFEQAVIYLLRNAREALRGYDALPHKAVELTACREAGDRIVMIVRDNGPGVPEELAERIFEPFFSTRPNDKHVGLGLSLVYGAVRDMGGEIALVQGGPGAVLKINLPEAMASLTPRWTH